MSQGFSRAELESELARLRARRAELERTACVDSRQTAELLEVRRDIGILERRIGATSGLAFGQQGRGLVSDYDPYSNMGKE